MTFDRDRPYNDLPPLPPRDVALETVSVLKHALAASRALAELKGAGGQIPNQHILLTGIVMQEARLSSEIENIVTTNDEIYQALANDRLPASPYTKEVLRYREALWYGYQQLRERSLCTNLFIEIAQRILAITPAQGWGRSVLHQRTPTARPLGIGRCLRQIK